MMELLLVCKDVGSLFFLMYGLFLLMSETVREGENPRRPTELFCTIVQPQSVIILCKSQNGCARWHIRGELTSLR